MWSPTLQMCFKFVLLSALVYVVWSQQCNPSNGPSGATTCIQLQAYNNQPQRAICLTNSSIQKQSGGRHHCGNLTYEYCWYQCMLASYSLESGPVSRDCSCTHGSTAARNLPLSFGGHVGLVGAIAVLIMCKASIFWCTEKYIQIDSSLQRGWLIVDFRCKSYRKYSPRYGFWKYCSEKIQHLLKFWSTKKIIKSESSCN